MDEPNKLHKKDLEKAAGGYDTIFHGDTPMCPTCGMRPIKMIASDEFIDTYQCHQCGMVSTHVKKLRPIPHPSKVCPRCGSLGKWNVLKTAGGVDTVECTVCRLQTTAPESER